MATIRINDAEWELFAGEPAALLKLYCVLKRRMDRETGVAGLETAINDIVLREGFTVDPLPGRKKPKPITREMWRSALRRMEKIGAIKVIGPNVFQFPNADGINPSKTATTKQQPQQQPQQQPVGCKPEPLYRVALSILDDLATTEAEPEQNTSNNLLLLKASSSTSCAQDSPLPERFWMRSDWVPNPDTWPALLSSYGLNPTDCTAARLLEFRAYWASERGKPERDPMSQEQWEHALAQSLERNVKRANAMPTARPTKKPHLRSVPTVPKRTNKPRDPCDAAQKAIDLAEDAAAEQRKAQGLCGIEEAKAVLFRHKRGEKP